MLGSGLEETLEGKEQLVARPEVSAAKGNGKSK